MDRLVTEIFFEKPNFEEVSKMSKALEDVGVKSLLLPPEDRGINTHLVVEMADLEKARETLKSAGANFSEKEVMLLRLENRPGTMAEAAMTISKKGINLNYAFSVAMDETHSLVLLGSDNNAAALETLKS
jgi:hypothetical protein